MFKKKNEKVETKKETTKNVSKNVETKDSKKNEKKGTAKVTKKENKNKVSIFKKIANYFKGVKQEMSKVKWPSKKDMLLYSGATLGFIIIFALFFSLNDVVISAVKQLVR